MRSIRGIGILNILLGVIALWLPLKFYSFATSLFTPEVSPPFSLGAIKTLTIFLFLPSIVLITNGIALISLSSKLEKVPELKAFSEAGQYIGRLKGVEIAEGEVERFDLEGEKEVLPKEQLTAVDDVMIIKKPPMGIGGVHHEFISKEVYNEFGEYLGKVESVTVDKKGELIDFLAIRGKEKRTITTDDMDSSDGVIIVKSHVK
ncbi:MAG: PRC-barrel domain-containing protein [Candidatus Hydrothermarchaeales archaeon]